MLDNLAYIRTSLESMDRPGHVELVHNAVSNSHEVFQPIESDGFNETNPGSNKAVPVGQMKGGDKVKGAEVESVTLEDLLTVTHSPTSTYIIKTDIEGYDCKVVDQYILERSHFYIPYIFMEWDWEDSTCRDLYNILHGAGYKPWLSELTDYSIKLSGKCLRGGCMSEESHSNKKKKTNQNSLMWIHTKENIIWPQKNGECFCEHDKVLFRYN